MESGVVDSFFFFLLLLRLGIPSWGYFTKRQLLDSRKGGFVDGH